MKVNESLQADNYQKYLINFNNLKQEIKNELDKNILDSEMQDNIEKMLEKHYSILFENGLFTNSEQSLFDQQLNRLLMLTRETKILLSQGSVFTQAKEVVEKLSLSRKKEMIEKEFRIINNEIDIKQRVANFVDNFRSTSSRFKAIDIAHQELTNIHSIK